MIEVWKNRPIELHYNGPLESEVEFLKNNHQMVEIYPSDKIICGRTYFKMGLRGSRSETFARKSVFLKIKELTEMLSPCKIKIFDAYRTLETQVHMFEVIQKDVEKMNPHFSKHELHAETKKFAAHPEEKRVLPHNSGGAIDLCIADKFGNDLYFGSEFDEPSEISNTLFFEREFKSCYQISKENWILARENRRILFHSMASLGFTNFKNEWWHYNLGNDSWSNIKSVNWSYPAFSFPLQL